MALQGNTRMTPGNKNIAPDIQAGLLTADDIIGSVGVHEGTHATDPASNIDTSPNQVENEKNQE